MGSELIELRCLLNDQAEAALVMLANGQGLGVSDVVCRALVVYETLERNSREGWIVVLMKPAKKTGLFKWLPRRKWKGQAYRMDISIVEEGD